MSDILAPIEDAFDGDRDFTMDLLEGSLTFSVEGKLFKVRLYFSLWHSPSPLTDCIDTEGFFATSQRDICWYVDTRRRRVNGAGAYLAGRSPRGIHRVQKNRLYASVLHLIFGQITISDGI